MNITLQILILIVTVFISLNMMNKSAQEKYLFIPYRVKHNNEFYRFFSYQFIHADITHLAFNMLSFYFLGKYLEQYFIYDYGLIQGEIYFFILYFFGGFFATLFPLIKHQENPYYQSLGASGSVSAVVFGFVLWNPQVDLLVFFIPMKAWLFGIIFLVYEFYASKKNNSKIAHDAHLGGAIFGILFILLINIEKGKEILTLFL